MEKEAAKWINLDFLVTFTGNDKTRMSKYITMFLNAAPAEAEKIRNGSAAGDWETVRAAAHSLRPQMTYMGIKSGETLLKEIEDGAREKNNPEQLTELTGRFDKLFIEACEELKLKLSQPE